MATETHKVPTPLSPVARFVFPQIQDNPNGWGPIEVPEQFKDTPYQPFSKDDRLGKVITIIMFMIYNCKRYCERIKIS